MSRLTSYLTAAVVAATVSLPTLAHAKDNSSHSSHCNSGKSNSGTQFSPGGVPFGQGPKGIPSNSGTASPGNKFAGLAGQNYQVDPAGNYNRVNAQVGENYQVNPTGSYNRFGALVDQNFIADVNGGAGNPLKGGHK